LYRVPLCAPDTVAAWLRRARVRPVPAPRARSQSLRRQQHDRSECSQELHTDLRLARARNISVHPFVRQHEVYTLAIGRGSVEVAVRR
jgi:hypothetical protein